MKVLTGLSRVETLKICDQEAGQPTCNVENVRLRSRTIHVEKSENLKEGPAVSLASLTTTKTFQSMPRLVYHSSDDLKGVTKQKQRVRGEDSIHLDVHLRAQKAEGGK